METEDKLTTKDTIPGIELRHVLGRGASSIVWEARQLSLQRAVAVKILTRGDDDRSTANFEREGQLLSTLRHPNIVTVYGAGISEQGNRYIIMELLEGGSLANMLETGPISAEVTFQITTAVLEGLQYAHNSGIVHRDLKPGNIMLVREQERITAKLVDFGISKPAIENDLVVQNLTRTGAATGTPAYMSPEVCSGQPASSRSDLYAVGCIVYEARTGTLPFRATSLYEVMYKHVHAPVPDLRTQAKTQLEKNLASIVSKSMQKDPADRFENAGLMKEALNSKVSTFNETKAAGMPAGRFLIPALIAGLVIVAAGVKMLPSRPEAFVMPGGGKTVLSLSDAMVRADYAMKQCKCRDAISYLLPAIEKVLLSQTRKTEKTFKDLAEAKLNLAKAYSLKAQYSEALKQLELGDEYSTRSKKFADPFWSLRVMAWRTADLIDMGKDTEAEKILQACKSKFRPSDSARENAIIQRFLAVSFAQLYRNRGERKKAAAADEEGLNYGIFLLDGPPNGDILTDTVRLGKDLYLLHRKEIAEAYAKQVIGWLSKTTRYTDSVLLPLSDLFWTLGKYDEASKYAMKSLDLLSRNHADAEFIAVNEAIISLIALSKHDLREAAEYSRRALKTITPEELNNGYVWPVYLAAGEVCLAKNRTEEALRYLQKAERLPRFQIHHDYDYRLNWLLARTHMQLHQPLVALPYMQKAFAEWEYSAPHNQDYLRMLREYLSLLEQTKSSAKEIATIRALVNKFELSAKQE